MYGNHISWYLINIRLYSGVDYYFILIYNYHEISNIDYTIKLYINMIDIIVVNSLSIDISNVYQSYFMIFNQ